MSVGLENCHHGAKYEHALSLKQRKKPTNVSVRGWE